MSGVPMFRLEVMTKKPNLKRSQKVPPRIWVVIALPPRLLRLACVVCKALGLADEVGPWASKAHLLINADST